MLVLPGLAGDGLAAPREVALVEAEGAELLVAAAHAHRVDAHRAELGHGGGPRQLELPLGADGGALAAGGAALVPVVAGYTHGEAVSCNARSILSHTTLLGHGTILEKQINNMALK